MAIIFWTRSCISFKYMSFLYPSLGATPNYITLKFKCLNKKSKRKKVVYLSTHGAVHLVVHCGDIKFKVTCDIVLTISYPPTCHVLIGHECADYRLQHATLTTWSSLCPTSYMCHLALGCNETPSLTYNIYFIIKRCMLMEALNMSTTSIQTQPCVHERAYTQLTMTL